MTFVSSALDADLPSGTPDSAEPRVGSSKPRSGAKMGTDFF